jgi:gas vesicle protein
MREYSRYEEPKWPEKISAAPPVGNTIVWLLAGIGIGAGVALLLAPSSGREVRDSIARGCRSTFDGISRGAEKLRQRGSNLLSFRRDRFEEISPEGSAKAGSAEGRSAEGRSVQG